MLSRSVCPQTGPRTCIVVNIAWLNARDDLMKLVELFSSHSVVQQAKYAFFTVRTVVSNIYRRHSLALIQFVPI